MYSTRGAPGAIIEHVIEGRIRLVISQLVLEELVVTIKKKKPEALPALRIFLISALPEVLEDPPFGAVKLWVGAIHLEDAAVLAAAIMAKPDYFISGDKHVLENAVLKKKSGLNIVAPAEFLKLLDL